MPSEKEPANTRTVIVFAGPNGSGKSTINAKFLSDPSTGFEGVYINADDIAKTLSGKFDTQRDLNIAAAVEAESQRIKCLTAGASFAFETVMSTPEKVALLSQARARGYDVVLVFVTTSDPEINVQRVANRVTLGGHDVPNDAIRQRYDSAMALLPVAIEQATDALIYDNSRDDQDPQLVARKQSSAELEVYKGQQIPAWAEERLQRDQNIRLFSLSKLGATLKNEGFDPSTHKLSMAEAAHGLRYDGRTVELTSVHVLQEAGAKSYVMHSRALIQDRPYRVGAVESVTYGYDRGKIAKRENEPER